MKIYTKTGDQGETSLYGGARVSKATARVESYGTLDELNAFIGLAIPEISDPTITQQLQKIQFDLFTLGSEAATPADQLLLANGKSRLEVMISDLEIEELEQWIDEWDRQLEPLQFFILPSGGKAAATLHVCRTVCRRAERAMVFLSETEEVRALLITYLNRLSDYLFVLARLVSKISGAKEQHWNPSDRKSS